MGKSRSHDMTSLPPITIGYRLGRLTVAEKTEERHQGSVVWRCRCDCGADVYLGTRAIRSGATRGCPDCWKLRPGQRDMTGMRFGRLVCLEPTGETRNNYGSYWRCKCDCGKEIVSYTTQLLNGTRRSCGCLNTEASRERLKLADGSSAKQVEYHKTHVIRSNTSGYTGVYWHKQMQKWGARIQFQRKRYSLGLYADIQDAVKARAKAEEMIFVGFLDWYYKAFSEKQEKIEITIPCTKISRDYALES